MHFDFFTIFATITCINIFISALLLFYIMAVKNAGNKVAWFFAGKSIETISFIALSLRDYIHDVFSIYMANILIIWGIAIQIISIVSFKGVFKNNARLAVIWIAVLGSIAFLAFGNSAKFRTLANTFTFMIFAFILAYEMWKEIKNLKMAIVMMASSAFYGVAMIWRAAYLIFFVDANYNPAVLNGNESVYVILSLFVILTNTIGFILLLKEQSDSFQFEKNELLNLAFVQSPLSIVITDENKKIKFVNPKFETITGYKSHEIIGKGIGILKSGNTPDEVYLELNNKLRNNEVWEGEFINKRKNGELFYEYAIIAALKSKNDSNHAYIAFKSDISLQKKLTEELLKSEQKYRLITENVADVIWIYNLTQDKFIFISPAIYNLRGYTVEEAMTQKLFDSVVPHFAEMLTSLIPERLVKFEQNRNNSTHYVDEIQQYTKTDKIIWVETSTKLRTNENNEIEIIGLSRNIEVRKKIEQELRRSKTNLKAAQKIGNVGHWDYDFKKGFMYWSEQTYKIFEVSPQTFVPEFKTVILLFHPQDRKMVLDAFDESVKNNTPLEITHRIITPGGKIKYLTERVTTRYDEEGNALSSLASVHDVTQTIENEIRLKELAATKDKFFSIIAHDLKNPFHGIIGLTEMLIQNFGRHTPQRTEELLNGIRLSATNAYRLLENLLVWAATQTGRLQYKPTDILIHELIDEVVQQSESMAFKKSIAIRKKQTGDIKVFADENMVHTVLRNLVSNAIKFTNQGGEIVIKARIEENMAQISVNDNGIGIEPKNLEKLFKLSEKYSTLGTSKETGTGLGLMLCKEFVELHGGQIWVESQPDEGSSFFFTLPLASVKT